MRHVDTIVLLWLALVVALPTTTVAQSECSSDVLLAIKMKDGQFLLSAAVQPADLIAKVNGKAVSISHFGPEAEKATVAILIDVSGSMAEAASLELDLARGIVAALPPDQPTMLVAFAVDSVVLASDRTGTVELLRAITGLKPQHRTALWDAIDQSSNGISSPHPIFIVLSDGGDSASKVSADAVQRKLQQRGARIIWLETRNHSFEQYQTPEELQGAGKTAQVAAATGGLAIRSDHPFGPSVNVEQAKFAARAVGAYFRVRLDLPPDVPRTGKLKISFAVNRPEFKGAQLLYPEQLPDCPAKHSP